jgi:hypothetical protein
LHLDSPTVGFDQAAGDCQAKTRAALSIAITSAGGLPPVKPFEDVREVGGRDAFTGIPYLDANAVPGSLG